MKIDYYIDPYYIDNTQRPFSYTYNDDCEGWQCWERKIKPEKEDKMTLTEKYLFNKKDARDREAIEQGALNEDGTLTEQGKDLLLNLLLHDKDIRTRFDLALMVARKEQE